MGPEEKYLAVRFAEERKEGEPRRSREDLEERRREGRKGEEKRGEEPGEQMKEVEGRRGERRGCESRGEGCWVGRGKDMRGRGQKVEDHDQELLQNVGQYCYYPYQ